MSKAADEEFLDRAFERAVLLIEEGSEPTLEELLDGREHLREATESLLRTARTVAVVRPRTRPRAAGYTILDELGRGGMGTVYLARQETLGGRHVALKVLPRSAGLSTKARERFLTEARAIANVRHPNVITVHDVVVDDGVHAYAMEWVDGASLADLLNSLGARGPEPPARGTRASVRETARAEPDTARVRELLGPAASALVDPYPVFVGRVGIAVARALGALHRAGLVHRDVKPSNILLRADGTPLLSDFGLVHAADGGITNSGQFAGTVAYASPEQLGGDPESLDARSDVYALGVTLYHALTLHLPFEALRGRAPRAHEPARMLRLIESGGSAPLRAWNRRLPRDLETIVAKAIEAEPARRYASADELALDLERLLTLRPIHARKAGVIARALKLARRHRGVLAASVVGAVAMLGLAITSFVYVVFVPRWVEEHVRAARLALLHPHQTRSLISMTLWGETRAPTAEGRASEQKRYATAMQEYDAALRLAPFDEDVRRERAVVAAAASGASVAFEDPRSAGLAAFLAYEEETAIEAWTRFEKSRGPLDPGDPMVDAALGVLLLGDDQPARAYLRLDRACRAFPKVAFLAAYLADAAVRCGDLERAEQLLEQAESLERQDPLGALPRVHADLLAAEGRDFEAEAAYRAIPASILSAPGLAPYHFAKFLEARGRLDEALEWYGLLARQIPRGTKPAREFVRAMDAWWAGIAAADRLARVRVALDEDLHDPESLVSRLAQYERSRVTLGSGAPSQASPSSRRGSRVALSMFSFLAAPRTASSSPALQSVSLHELATRMEVTNMSHWGKLASYPRLIREVQSASWSCPGLRPLAITATRIVDTARELPFQIRSRGSILLGIAGAAGFSNVAIGDVQAFGDKTTFLTATSATPAHAPFSNLGIMPGGVAGVYATGSVVFSITAATGLHIGDFSVDWTPVLPGVELAISGPENPNIDLDAPVHSLGFDFVEPSSGSIACSVGCGGCSDSTFDVTLKFGGAPVGIFQFNAPDDVAAFVGVWSDAPFDRVEIRDLSADCEDE